MTISAAAAYRLDAAGRNQASGVDDDRAIIAGAVLQHAALLPAPQRSGLLRDAIEIAIEIIGEPEVERLAAREWQHIDRTPSEAIMLLAESVQRVGSFNLARVLLDGVLQADDSLTVVQRGRVLAARARIAWKLGFFDDARERYELIARLARKAKSPELKARASSDWPRSLTCAGTILMSSATPARAARIADREGFREIGRKAHNALMIVAGVSRRLTTRSFTGGRRTRRRRVIPSAHVKRSRISDRYCSTPVCSTWHVQRSPPSRRRSFRRAFSFRRSEVSPWLAHAQMR